MLSGKLNIYHDSVKNEKLRQIAWITNTIEDKEIIEQMFWPSKDEIIRNKRMNQQARQWLIDQRLIESKRRAAQLIRPTENSAFHSLNSEVVLRDSELDYEKNVKF